MAAEERWYFSKEQLENTPSKKCGIDPEKEVSYRQQAANFIQDMGQRLQVNQLCINTSIVYMHRFYMFHSFQKFHRNAISTCALFLAAKVEEQPRKLEHVIKVAHLCLHRDAPALDPKSEAYLEQAQELVINENIMLQTLGFDVAIDHPHTHVVKCCQLVRGGWSSIHQHHASKDLAQTSYFMATNSLHLTTMCLQYKPTVVACVCIHLACKWANWEIPKSSEGKRWFWYVEKTVTEELLEELTAEFLAILDRCPSRLKRKMMNSSSGMEKMPDPSCYDKKQNADLGNASGSSNKLSPSFSGAGGSSSSGASASKCDRGDHFNTPLPALVRDNLFSKMGGSSSKTANAVDKNGGLALSSTDRKHKKETPQNNPTHPPTSVNSSSATAPPSFKQAEPLKTLPDQRHGAAPPSSSPTSTDFPPPTHNSTENLLQQPSSQQHQNSPVSVGSSSSSNNNNSGNIKKLKPSSKEYREYMEQVKNRERAEKEREKQPPPPPSSSASSSVSISSHQILPYLNRIEGLTIGNTPLSSLNLQPVVSLTQINPSCLEKLTAPRQPNKPHHKTPEKQRSLPIGAGAANPSLESEKSKHHHHHHHHHRGASGDEKAAHGQKHHQGNHVGRSHRLPTPSKATSAAVAVMAEPPLAKPPILTPSPPLSRDEDFQIPKMDATSPKLQENPMMATPPTPLLPVACEALTVKHPPPKAEHHRRKEREEIGGGRLPLVEPPPPPQRRHETKDSKERQIKPHKSKTPPVITQQQPQSLELQSPQKAIIKPMPVEVLLTPSSKTVSQHPSSITPQPHPPPQSNIGGKPDFKPTEQEISRTIPPVSHAPQQQPPPATTSSSAASSASNSNPVIKNSSSSLNETVAHLPQPHSRLPPPLSVGPAAIPTTRETGEVRETKALKAESVSVPAPHPQPPPPPVPAESNERHSAPTPKQPHQSSKREKKHKAKSRDRDKERSHDKRESSSSTGSTPVIPAIKLLIPKERLNLSAASMGSGSSSKHSSEPQPPPERSGSLKLKISKEMLNESSLNSGKSNSFTAVAAPPVPREVPAAPQPPPPAPAPPPQEMGGASLKIKITKDRTSATGSYNLSVGSDTSSKNSDRESRKRERDSGSRNQALEEAEDAKPPKMPRQSVRASRRSGDGNGGNTQQQHGGHGGGSLLDVPPSSNTRSSRQEPAGSGYPQALMHQPQHMPPQQRGRKGGVKPMGMQMPPPYGHQVNLNAGGYPPYPQYYTPYGGPPPSLPNYYMHPGEYAPHPQFFNQYGPPTHLPPPRPGMQFPHPPPPHLMQQQQQQRSMPPLPREPPPVIPPPPPPE